MNTEIDALETGKADMRGHIQTHGIASAALAVATRYADPFDQADTDRLAGIILAAYEAGQLDGINKVSA